MVSTMLDVTVRYNVPETHEETETGDLPHCATECHMIL